MENILKIVVILFSLNVSINCLDLCGDWTQYKDRKCFKVLPIKATQADALEKCVELNNDSTLVTLYDIEEQQFINQLLVEFNNISMNAWIGMEYNGHEYDWMDGTDSNFTNWSEDALHERTDICVRMSLLNRTLGKWTDSSCKRQALIVCQRRQILSFNSMKDIIEDMIKTIDKQKTEFKVETKVFNERHENQIKSLTEVIENQLKLFKKQTNGLIIDNYFLKDTNYRQQNQINFLTEIVSNQRNESQKLINKLKVENEEQNNDFNTKTKDLENKINSLTEVIENQQNFSQKQTNDMKLETEEQNKRIDSLIPLGFLYTQLPEQLSPQQLWPHMEWSEVTQQYSGLFFRAEGGGSEPFGQIQHANQSWISKLSASCHSTDSTKEENYSLSSYIQGSGFSEGNGIHCVEKNSALNRFKIYTTAGEVRPKNTAVKIWKRIQ